LERLIANGIDPNLGDYDGRTALHLAAACGAQKSVEYLLAQGADPCARDRWGGLPLMDAVKAGHSLVADIIRQAGGKLHAEEDGGGSASQLCDAAAAGDVSFNYLQSY
jgi:ankyrin repeat protein